MCSFIRCSPARRKPRNAWRLWHAPRPPFGPPPAVGAAATGRTTKRPGRGQVEGSLKELEARGAKSPPLSARISQAGLSWSTNQFLVISAVLGTIAFLGFLVFDVGLPAALGA